MKYILLLLSIFYLPIQSIAKSNSDVVEISLVMWGGNHTISTFIGSDIDDIYSVIYRYSNHGGDEFGMPIYILSPGLVKHIEHYILSQSFFYPPTYCNDSLFYYAGFKTEDIFGVKHYLTCGIGGLKISESYFWRMLRWIELYPTKQDSPEYNEFVDFFQPYFIDFKGGDYTPLQHKRTMDRWCYEGRIRR